MASHAIIGTWEVINCVCAKGSYMSNYMSNCEYVKCMEGIKVRLDENGDVTWTVPQELKSVPLFCCETYEIYRQSSRSGIVLRFGAYAGHVFEFMPDKVKFKDNVKLICDGLCSLHCVRVNDDSSEGNITFPFTLLPALEDGYFSDLTLTSSNNKKFKVHSVILELQGDDIDWNSEPPPLSDLSEDVLGTILHFLYAECLPESLTDETAKQVIAAVSSYPSMGRLVDSCQVYLKNMALKQQIIGLVNDMHCCLNQVIDRFNPKNLQSSESITANPAKMCFVVKQSMRDAAVAGAKLLLLCDLFTKRKAELTRNERHEIIRYAKSRLPIFLTQLTRFLQALKNTFGSMSPGQRVEMASFLVPEIEVILDTVSMMVNHVEKALQQIIRGLFIPDAPKCKSGVGETLSKTLRTLLHIRELTKLNTFHEHISCSLGLLVHKKENFKQMSSSQKIRSISRNLEQLIEELPIFLLKLEETAAAFDEKLEWRDFKFCFKVGTSKVSDILDKLIVHTDFHQKVMLQICELVQRDNFTQALQCLGLLNGVAAGSNPNDSKSCPSFSTTTKLNLVESLCTPPDSKDSLLSTKCSELLENGKRTDMEFEVLPTESAENEEAASPDSEKADGCVIRSHRVLVAARCDWFRRALLSGMREAIDKKIQIHDTTPFLFRIFLEYLYSGRLKPDSLTADQLLDLLLLSDKYETDSLKQTCECALLPHVDADSVIYFLSMADQYNARALRVCCLNFISQHQDLTESEEFFDLPISLQAEIFDCVWTQPSGRQSDDFAVSERLVATSGSSKDSSDVNDLNAEVGSMLLTPALDSEHSAHGSLEELRLDQTSARMESCLELLRDIIGDTAPREVLVQVILAADFDLRRAVNYYYARSNADK